MTVDRILRKIVTLVREAGYEPPEGGDGARLLRRLGVIRTRRQVLAARSALSEEEWRLVEAFTVSGPCVEKPRCSECGLRGECAYARRKPTMKELPETERPRERLLKEGAGSLSDAELVAILLRTGTRQESAVELAKRLLHRFGSLRELAEAGVGELKNAVAGLGDAKIAQLKAGFELARRLRRSIGEGDVIRSSQDAFHYIAPCLDELKKENFWVILLDTKNRVIRRERISEGSLDSSIVHPREVFRPAIRESASSIICVHNHPSGDPSPSPDDIRITERLKETAELVGIKFLDHLIVGRDSYESLADRGLV